MTRNALICVLLYASFGYMAGCATAKQSQQKTKPKYDWVMVLHDPSFKEFYNTKTTALIIASLNYEGATVEDMAKDMALGLTDKGAKISPPSRGKDVVTFRHKQNVGKRTIVGCTTVRRLEPSQTLLVISGDWPEEFDEAMTMDFNDVVISLLVEYLPRTK